MDAYRSDAAMGKTLLQQADRFCAELLDHPVLSRYRDEITIILKGSTAHGYSDCYSDVDLVVFCHQARKQEIVDEYVRQGLSQRRDGVFLPLGNWVGHYQIDTYEELTQACGRDSAEYLWEYSGSKVLHDPRGSFAAAVNAGLETFRQKLPGLTKAKYLDCQLQLDWLRQPLRRADFGASMLYTSAVYSGICQLLFLLRGKPYPCHKWLPYYFEQLDIPDALKEQVGALPGLFARMWEDFLADLDLMEYPVYRQASEIMEQIQILLKETYGAAQWIGEWYLYV